MDREESLVVPADVAELRQRTDPFLRLVAFCKTFHPRQRSAVTGKEVGLLEESTVLRLVMQHMAFLGFTRSLESLEDESNVPYLDPGLDESRLLSMIRGSSRYVDEIYDLVMSYPADYRPPELDECLFQLSLIEERDDGLDDLDKNIWLENITPVGPNSALKTASVNELFLRLTSESQSDVSFLKTFLMTYQSFIKPNRLLAKLMERFVIPSNAELSAAEAMKIKSRCINVLKQWITTYPLDFSDLMISDLSTFVSKMGGVFADSLQVPLSKLQKARKRAEKGKSGFKLKFNHDNPPPEPIVNLKTIFLPQFTLHMMDVEELARQLTLMFHGIFLEIQPSEMLDASWTKPNKNIRAPNVCKFILSFNHTSYLVAHSILHPKTANKRASMYRFWVRVAQHLVKLNNFTVVMAVLGAFNISSVHRLKQTIKEVPSPVRQSLQEIEKLMSTQQSFKAYREHVAGCMPPAVPYVGLLLQDLTFIETNPNRIDGLVSWTKRTKIYESIDSVLRFQSSRYNLQHVPQITEYIRAQPLYGEEELYALSLQREPRKPEQ